jgi:hypothetical protein
MFFMQGIAGTKEGKNHYIDLNKHKNMNKGMLLYHLLIFLTPSIHTPVDF